MDQKTHHIGAVYSTVQNIGLETILHRYTFDSVDTTYVSNYMDKYQINCVIYDIDMPGALSTIVGGPKIMYYVGNIGLLENDMIGIVGPRKMSSYGQRIISELFTHLCEYRVVTVSGGAEGVDRAVHDLSLQYNIPTVVVLAGGIGTYYESGKYHFLQKVVAQGGLILSEYPLFMPSHKYTFPQRNRIIAGLGDILFLPEAGEKSGSLITLESAIKQKKPIYAPLGPLFSSTSVGTNRYIVAGKITPLYSLQDFLGKYFEKKLSHERESSSDISDIDNISSTQNLLQIGDNKNSDNVAQQLVLESMRELGLL